MRKSELIDALQRIRPSLAHEGVAHLSIFGSRARGDNRPESDIDLLIDIAHPEAFSLLNLIGIEQMVTDQTGLVTNAVLSRGLDDAFRTTVERDAVRVF